MTWEGDFGFLRPLTPSLSRRERGRFDEACQTDGGAEDSDAEEAAAAAGRAGEGRRGRGRVGDFREAFGAVAVDEARRADAVGAEESGQARDRGRQAVGGEGRGAEEGELGATRPVRMRGEGEAADGSAGRAGLELQAHERQESLDLARWRGQRDRARVAAVGIE